MYIYIYSVYGSKREVIVMSEYIISNIEKFIIEDDKLIYAKFNGKILKNVEIKYDNIINIQKKDKSDFIIITYLNSRKKEKIIEKKLYNSKENRRFFKNINDKLKIKGYKVVHRNTTNLEAWRKPLKKMKNILISLFIIGFTSYIFILFKIDLMVNIMNFIYEILGVTGISISIIELFLLCILNGLYNMYNSSKKIIIE